MKTLSPEIESNLPMPLWDAYQAFVIEDDAQPFRKVHRLIDLIEVFCKLHTAASLATFLNALRNRLDQGNTPITEESFTKIKVMLVAGLKTPSLGIWRSFDREISSILKKLDIPHILSGVEKESSILLEAFDEKNNLITFRNSYAHGGTKKDAVYKKDLEEIWPRMLQLLNDAVSLREVSLVICTNDLTFLRASGSTLSPIVINENALPGHTWFCSNGLHVDAFPILNFRLNEGNADFFFYNDYDKNHARYLNYPNGEHVKDANLKQEILHYIPIEDWKKNANVDMDPFRQQIEMLTEVFKGRKNELGQIASFLSDEQMRFLCIWGPPGVGKSALLARATQIARCSSDVREILEDSEQWPQGKLHLIEYFIRRGATETASQFFDSVNQRLDYIFNLRFDFGKLDSEKQALFKARIDQVSKQLKDDERLLLIIDGLDEIKSGDPLLSLLPKLLPEKIQIVFGARPQQELRFTFYEQLDRERKTGFDLGGLSLADIRAVLMEHVSKYEMQQEYVDEVLRISEGNPLYLKMLCSGLEQHIYKLNHIAALPKGMDELYETAFLRLEKDYPGSLNFMLYLAAAKDFVSPELAAQWIGLETTQLRNRLLYACLEFLYENPTTEWVEDYQLFHESLREYLSKRYPAELQACKERICDWAVKWKKDDGDIAFDGEILVYAMEFSTEHIYENYVHHRNNKRKAAAENRRKQLFELTENEQWRALNFETCGNGLAISKSYYFLQRVLAVEDGGGEKFQEFINYAYNRYAEPERMYLLQRDLLMQPVKRDRLSSLLERTHSLAKMGDRDEDKVLLALLPLWANNFDELPKQLEERINEWIENTRNSAVKKLWITTQKRVRSSIE